MIDLKLTNSNLVTGGSVQDSLAVAAGDAELPELYATEMLFQDTLSALIAGTATPSAGELAATIDSQLADEGLATLTPEPREFDTPVALLSVSLAQDSPPANASKADEAAPPAAMVSATPAISFGGQTSAIDEFLEGIGTHGKSRQSVPLAANAAPLATGVEVGVTEATRAVAPKWPLKTGFAATAGGDPSTAGAHAKLTEVSGAVSQTDKLMQSVTNVMSMGMEAGKLDATRMTAGVYLATASENQTRLEQPVGTAAWRQELANRINMMFTQGEQAVTLRLSPENLGPIEIRVAIREGDTSLWFGAAHPETRQALEQTLPKLREQFAQAGLTLGQSWISNGSPQHSPWHRDLPMVFDGAQDVESTTPDAETLMTGSVIGLVDTYA